MNLGDTIVWGDRELVVAWVRGTDECYLPDDRPEYDDLRAQMHHVPEDRIDG